MKPIISIANFKTGQIVQGFFLVVEKQLRHTRGGDLYLDLVLRDQTGQIPGKIWDKVTDFDKKFQQGDPVAAKGAVEIFLDRPQLVIKRINKATVQNYARYGFDPGLIVPTADQDPKAMWKEITRIIRSLKNGHLKTLLLNIYNSNKDKLLIHPASVSHHHNYRSGLLDHILSMAKIALNLAPHYKVDQDLLMGGILLHDLGKLQEIKSGYEAAVTEAGNFKGHVILGRDMFLKEVRKVSGFPKILTSGLEHIILAQAAHSGERSRAPVMLEAFLVELIKNMDSKMNLMEIALKDDPEQGNWTNRHNYFKIPLYKGENGTE